MSVAQLASEIPRTNKVSRFDSESIRKAQIKYFTHTKIVLTCHLAHVDLAKIVRFNILSFHKFSHNSYLQVRMVSGQYYHTG